MNFLVFPSLRRPYWRCYFPNTQAVIYVVDSTDVDRISTSKDEFHSILQVFAFLFFLERMMDLNKFFLFKLHYKLI